MIVALMIVAVLYGVFLYEKIISGKNDIIERLKIELDNANNFAPDVLLSRLTDRHKKLSEEVEVLIKENEESEGRITELQRLVDEAGSEAKEWQAQLTCQLENYKTDIGNKEKRIVVIQDELLQTRLEAKKLNIELEGIQKELKEYWDDQFRPREGKFNSEVANEFIRILKEQGFLYMAVDCRCSSQNKLEQISKEAPYIIEVCYPGMSKMILIIYGKSDRQIGFVFNPYIGIYDKDFFVTLLRFLKCTTGKNFRAAQTLTHFGLILSIYLCRAGRFRYFYAIGINCLGQKKPSSLSPIKACFTDY